MFFSFKTHGKSYTMAESEKGSVWKLLMNLKVPGYGNHH